MAQASCLCTPCPLPGTVALGCSPWLESWRCSSWKYPTRRGHACHWALHPGTPSRARQGCTDTRTVPWGRQDSEALLRGQWLQSLGVSPKGTSDWRIGLTPRPQGEPCGVRAAGGVAGRLLKGSSPALWGTDPQSLGCSCGVCGDCSKMYQCSSSGRGLSGRDREPVPDHARQTQAHETRTNFRKEPPNVTFPAVWLLSAYSHQD